MSAAPSAENKAVFVENLDVDFVDRADLPEEEAPLLDQELACTYPVRAR